MDDMHSFSGSQAGESAPVTVFTKTQKFWKLPSPMHAGIEVESEGFSLIGTNLRPRYLSRYPGFLNVGCAEYLDAIGEFNKVLQKYWPSKLVIIMSILLIPLSCCFSLLITRLCLSEAERQLQNRIDEQNILWEKRGVYFGWKDGRLMIFTKSRSFEEDEIKT